MELKLEVASALAAALGTPLQAERVNMKKSYRVPCSWEMYGHIHVAAESWDEAIEKALADEMPLPSHQESAYVLASFEIDREAVEYLEAEEAL